MDEARAKRIARELKGQKVGGWSVIELVNNGKSALVFKAVNNGTTVALKVFDPDLVESYGREKQLKRIEREKSLIGATHPNLIQIHDGGYCEQTDYLYVVMEFLPFKNLAQKITEVPPNLIQQIISQVASAAQFLEGRNLAHRDIKPANIVISDDFQRAVLLDLGVLRPIGLSDLTDNAQRVFLGTLQYSPPELLLRDEVDSIEGWRAVTFYQLGAVLHDMIMRQPLFIQESQPFAKLVEAVHHSMPMINSTDVGDHLKLLARCCLLKEPKIRLAQVKWEDFLSAPKQQADKESLRRGIMQKQVAIKRTTDIEAITVINDIEGDTKFRIQSASNEIENIIRTICTSDYTCFPSFEIHRQILDNGMLGLLDISFGPSPKHSLSHILKLHIWISIKDVRQDLISLKSLVIRFMNAPGNAIEDSHDADTIYEAPYDIEIIKNKLIELLYWSLDECLKLEMCNGNTQNLSKTRLKLPNTPTEGSL